MALNKPCVNTGEFLDRNQSSSSTSTARYKPLLAAHGDGGSRKRFSDTPIDSLRLVPTNGRSDVSSGYLSGKFSSSFYPRPRKQPRSPDTCTGTRNNSATIQSKERGTATTASIISRQANFDWSAYLKEINAVPVPASFFIHLPSELRVDFNLPTGVSDGPSTTAKAANFQVDQYLEGIDPHQESLFCVLKVAEVVGRRLRLRFVGYPEKYDFWTTADSPFLFPVGWCAHNKRHLQPPKSYLDRGQTTFNWEEFLSRTNGVAAPRHLFRVPWNCSVATDENADNLFRVGDKLEAIDKRNPTTVCVATVKDRIGDYLLIRFDGWEASFDQWAHISSELLHPVGFCEDQELVLSIPREWSTRPEGFTWKQYLKETHSKQVPPEAIQKSRLSQMLKVGQRLEAVDRRCPQLIRVAHVAGISQSGFVDIAFDGWSEKFNLCLESSCAGLFPVGYCQATGHPLQLPPGYLSDTATAEVNGATESPTAFPSSVTGIGAVGSPLPAQNSCCPTPGCKGYGHVKGPRFASHQRISGCPYADINLRKDFIRGYERLAYTGVLSVATKPVSNSCAEEVPFGATRVNGGVPPTRASTQCSVDAGDATFSSSSSGQVDHSNTPPPPPLSISATSSNSAMKSPGSLNNQVSPRSPGFSMDRSLELPPSMVDALLACSRTSSFNCSNHIDTHSQVSTVASVIYDPATGVKDVTCLPLVQAVPPPSPQDNTAFTSSNASLDRQLDAIAPTVPSGADLLTGLDQTGHPPPPVLTEQEPAVCPAVDGYPKVDNIELNANMATAATIANAAFKLPEEGYPKFGSVNDLSFGLNTTSDSSPSMPEGVHRASPCYTSSQNKACHQPGAVKWEQAKQYGKQRLTQLPTDFHIQQAALANSVVAGMMPVKRKRGRPRKLANTTGMDMVQSTPIASTCSSTSARTVSGPRQRSTGPMQQAYQSCAYTTVLIAGQHSQPIMAPFAPSAYSVSGTAVSTAHVLSPFTNLTPGNHSEPASLSPLEMAPASSSSANGQLPTADQLWVGSGPTSVGGMPVLDSPVHTSISTPTTGNYEETGLNLSTARPPVLTTSALPMGGTEASPAFTGADPGRLMPEGSWCSPEGPPFYQLQMGLTRLPGVLQNSNSQQHPVYAPSGQPVFSTLGGLPIYQPHQQDAKQESVDLLNRLLPQAGAALQAAKAAGLPGPHSWSVEMVGHFVATLPGCKQFSSKFIENEIDGAALLCLEQRDLMHILGMRLGPAVKVSSAIQTLRRGLLETPLYELSVDHSSAFAAATSCFNLPPASVGHPVANGPLALTTNLFGPPPSTNTTAVFPNPGQTLQSFAVTRAPAEKPVCATVTHFHHDPGLVVPLVIPEESG